MNRYSSPSTAVPGFLHNINPKHFQGGSDHNIGIVSDTTAVDPIGVHEYSTRLILTLSGGIGGRFCWISDAPGCGDILV